MALRAVVFDLDGTLIDSRADIARAANHALRDQGFPELSIERISAFVGDGAELLLARASGLPVTDARIQELYASFIEFYSAHPADHTALLPGAAAALDGRLGVPLALCTNKPRVTTDRVLAALGIAGSFAFVNAGGDLPQKKPDPAPLLHIARALGAAPGDVVMVGDGAQDVLAGRAAGMRTIGVRGGIQPEERLLAAEPEVLIDTLDELVPALDRFR